MENFIKYTKNQIRALKIKYDKLKYETKNKLNIKNINRITIRYSLKKSIASFKKNKVLYDLSCFHSFV